MDRLRRYIQSRFRIHGKRLEKYPKTENRIKNLSEEEFFNELWEKVAQEADVSQEELDDMKPSEISEELEVDKN